jgi:ribosomal protein S18 acetylase RimI-like enzyme
MRHKATIWGMYVNATYRGQSIGGKLMDVAIAHARHEMHAKVIGLTVESTNVAGLALYRSRGFYVWGTEKMALVQDGKYTNEDHMDLEL